MLRKTRFFAMIAIIGLVLPSVLLQDPKQTFRDVDDLCLHCICQASTGCQPKGCMTLDNQVFCGPYQISKGYWQDGGQLKVPNGGPNEFEACATNQECSENTVRSYLLKYARNCNKDTVLDCDDIARLHKAGPFACDKPDLEKTPYWDGFVTCYYGGKK